MASNHRKMLFPGTNFTFTFVIPCFQTYPPPPPPPQRNLSGLVTTSICIMGSFLLVLFLTIFLYLYIKQSRQISPVSVPPGGTNRRENENDAGERSFSGDHHVWRVTNVGLHRSKIDSIAVVGYKKGEGIIDGTECSVCLNEFEEDESLRLLPKCSHAFHINCIDTWLLSHKNCPLCRAPIFPPKPRNNKTETNHQPESGASNDDLNGEEESLGSRNANVLPREQSDLASHCGSRSLETVTVRRSFSIGGSSSVKAGDSDDIATRSGRHFNSSLSANFFSSLRNQDSVLPSRMPSVSG